MSPTLQEKLIWGSFNTYASGVGGGLSCNRLVQPNYDIKAGYLQAVMLSSDNEGFEAQRCLPQFFSQPSQLPLLLLTATLQPPNLNGTRQEKHSRQHQNRKRLQTAASSSGPPLPGAPRFPAPPPASPFLSADPLYFAPSAGSPAAPAAP